MKFVLNLSENPEFEISSTSPEVALRQIDHYLSILEEQSDHSGAHEKQNPASPIGDNEAMKLGCTIFDMKATIEIIQNEPEHATSYLRSLNSHLKKMVAFLKEQKIEIIDHTNETFHPTMKVDVLEFEEDPEVEDPTISETIEPSIYFLDKLIKRGKVIVKKK